MTETRVYKKTTPNLNRKIIIGIAAATIIVVVALLLVTTGVLNQL